MNALESLLIKNDINFDSVCVFRNDGQLIINAMKKNSGHNELKMKSFGALISGAWQASFEAAKYLNNISENEMRFSFDNSNSGFQVIPLIFRNETWFICLSFSNVLNSAKEKVKIRNLKHEIIEVLNRQLKVTYESQLSTKKNLFENLNDSEIDDAFSKIRI